MTLQTQPIHISQSLYQQLEKQAKSTKRTITELVQKAIVRNLPPPIDDELPMAIQEELEAMASLSDDALWQIAESQMNADKIAMYDLFLERNKEDSLTHEGKTMLKQLREEGELLTLRKAHAYLLLQSRGFTLPTLAELQHSTK
jgi:hypothetical protein